jgi:hypothetical protein
VPYGIGGTEDPDAIISLLEDTLTPAEPNLVQMGQHQRLRDMRLFFQYATLREFCEPIEPRRWTRAAGTLTSPDAPRPRSAWPGEPNALEAKPSHDSSPRADAANRASRISCVSARTRRPRRVFEATLQAGGRRLGTCGRTAHLRGTAERKMPCASRDR